MKVYNYKPDLNTFNELIKIYKYSNESVEKKIEFMMDILKEMKNTGITPNLNTFNNCLVIVKSFGINQNALFISLNILKEMEVLNIGKLVKFSILAL